MTRVSDPPLPNPVIPLLPSVSVYRLLTLGAGLCGFAAILGLFSSGPSLASTARLLLVAAGLLVSASALVQRPDLWLAWLLAALTGGAAVGGIPAHWDSARLVAGVLGALALVGALLVWAPAHWRHVILSLALLFHFGALVTATTSPDTQGLGAPWLTQQASERVYKPYWAFLYLGNAYHFYSPDPGPASHLFFLVRYQTDEDEVDEQTGQVKLSADGKPIKRTAAEWVDMPRRQTQYRDPLGMTYYRRLSLTELVSYSLPGTAALSTMEVSQAIQRRRENLVALSGTPVPGVLIGNEIDLNQYRIPFAIPRRIMIPAYARHIAAEYSDIRKGKNGQPVQYTVTSVKMFRVEHRVISPNQLLTHENSAEVDAKRLNPKLNITPRVEGGYTPYHPSLYSPYYLGEYDPSGSLVNPRDPLLYWLVPIQYVPYPSKWEPDFKDFMSAYAGYTFDWRGKE